MSGSQSRDNEPERGRGRAPGFVSCGSPSDVNPHGRVWVPDPAFRHAGIAELPWCDVSPSTFSRGDTRRLPKSWAPQATAASTWRTDHLALQPRTPCLTPRFPSGTSSTCSRLLSFTWRMGKSRIRPCRPNARAAALGGPPLVRRFAGRDRAAWNFVRQRIRIASPCETDYQLGDGQEYRDRGPIRVWRYLDCVTSRLSGTNCG